MAKDEVFNALKKLRRPATKDEIMDRLVKDGADVMDTVVWQALSRLRLEGAVSYNKATGKWRITNKRLERNVVMILPGGRTRRLSGSS